VKIDVKVAPGYENVCRKSHTKAAKLVIEVVVK
jgi:hypothetical protein